MNFNYLISGNKGMNKSIWNKLISAPFGCSQSIVNRPMCGYEVSLIQTDANLTLLRERIGKVLIGKYDIQID
jgi:hypothetical protein